MPAAETAALVELAALGSGAGWLTYVLHSRRRLRASLEHQAKIVEALEEQSMHIRHEFLNGAARMGVYVRRIDDAGEALGPVASGAVAAIERERRTLVASTEAILRLSRVRTGERRTRPEDLAQLAGEVVDMLEAKAEEKGVRLTVALAPARTLGDSGMLALMIANIVGNAIKYSPAPGLVAVTTRTDEDRVGLIVDDSGPGIAPDLRDSVFTPRLRIESTAEEPGHGYGLAIAMAVAVQHRGTIAIDDSPHGGARFQVALPLYRGD